MKKMKTTKTRKRKNNLLKELFNGITILVLTAIILCGLKFYSTALASNLNFVQISDVHFSTLKINTSYRLLAESQELLQDAIEQVNAMPDINFVMFTGDMINKPYQKELEAFLPYANELNVPWYAVLGNHDVCVGGKLSKKLYLEILNEKNKNFNFTKSYYSFSPQKGYRVIGLDTIIDTRLTSNGYIDEVQLKWLDKELTKYKNDVVLIFMHGPVVEPLKSESHSLNNANQVLDVLLKHKAPIALFSGHYHTTKVIQKGNLLFVSTPALVSYPNAFRTVRISNQKNKVIFNFEIKETRYKDVQKRAKMMAFGAKTYYGEEKDRDATYIINKNNKDKSNEKN